MDTLILRGDAVKAFGSGKVGGYLVRFTGPGDKDLEGDYFTAATYYGPRDGDGAECLFHHGLPVKAELADLADRTFRPIRTRRDTVGIWAETVLNMADEYEAKVYNLAKAGKLGWSSGTAAHRVKRASDGRVTRWPIAEGSLTPTPAMPANYGDVRPIKALLDDGRARHLAVELGLLELEVV